MTIIELKKQITDKFMATPELVAAYGLDATKSFDQQFSKVSFESMLFYVVAFCHYLIYNVIEVFKIEQQAAMDAAVVANNRWYHALLLKYRAGQELVFNANTYKWDYSEAVIASTSPTLGYVAVPDADSLDVQNRTIVKIKVSKTDKSPLTINQYVITPETDITAPALVDGEILGCWRYIQKTKPAGVRIHLISAPADILQFNDGTLNNKGITIFYNPMLMKSSGELIATPGTYPVEIAINAYIDSIIYGGKFNQNKCIDAIQQALGVVDCYIDALRQHTYEDGEGVYEDVEKTVECASGCFTVENLRESIAYQAQSEL